MNKQFLKLTFFTLFYISISTALSAQKEMFSPVVPQIKAFEQTAQITWTSTTGLQNDYFVIERSADNVNFSALQTIDGDGEEGQTIHFDELDEKPVIGTNYYRLRQVFKDGTVAMTNTVALSFSGSATR
jgi:hypothetical protein